MRFLFFQAEDGIRDLTVTGVQTCALPISLSILTPSVNNLTVRILVRAAGLDFEERDVWGKKDAPAFIAKDPAQLTPLLEERSEERRVGKECRSGWNLEKINKD